MPVGCSVWLAHADNSRGFTAKVAAAGCSHPDNRADERHPIRMRGTHAAPEVLLEVHWHDQQSILPHFHRSLYDEAGLLAAQGTSGSLIQDCRLVQPV